MVAGRLDFGHELRRAAELGPWGSVELSRPPSAFVAELFLDTVTFDVRPLRLALDTVGAGRLCFGTDGPPVPFPASRARTVVSRLGLPPAEADQVLGDNAAALFRIGKS
jgi:aminocarboxymuconate-semialdehyde decarboxylase